jgi:molybdopterin molybdotransferase
MLTCAASDQARGCTVSLLDLGDALARLHTLLDPVAEVAHVPLPDALGRCCAEAVHAPADIPAFANSAMDGYAVRWQPALAATLPVRLRRIGTSFAGHAFDGTLTDPATCVRIFTGAPLPDGADTIVIQENTRADGDEVTLLEPARHGQWVRAAGHDLRAGALVVAAGTRLEAQHIGLCAAAGVSTIAVRRSVRVAVLSNGDELVDPGTALAPGQIYDSNRATLKAMLAAEPVEVLDLGRVGDHTDAIQAALDRARTGGADLVLCSGGVSVGDADLVREVVQRNGEIDFWRIAIKPGKPLAFARLDATGTTAAGGRAAWFIGLPGNPVSTFITYQAIVRPAIRRLAGIDAAALPMLRARAAHRIEKDPGRLEWQRGVLHVDAEGRTAVRNTGNQSSGMLSSVVAANCFIVLARDQGDVEEGTEVQVLPFAGALAG